MSNEPEIGKELTNEEKLVGFFNTSPNKAQDAQIAKDSSGTVLGLPSSFSGNSQEVLENTQNSNNRKNAEPSKDLSEKYRLIAISTSDLIAFTTFDINPVFTFVTPSYLKFLGFEAEELLGKSWLDFIHQDDKQQIRTILTRYIDAKINGILTAVMAEEAQKLDFRIRDKLGHWYFLHSIINIVNDELLFISKDITEQKKAQEALTTSEYKYRNLYNSLRDGSAAVDLQGKIIECNNAFENMLGYSVDELRSVTFEDITPVKWHSIEKRILEDQVMRRGYSDLYEKEYKRKDGKIFPVELQTYSIRNNEDQLCGFWAFVRDVTIRKQTEEALRGSEERFRLVISGITDILYEWNIKTGLIQWFGDIDSRLGYVNGALPRTLEAFLKHVHPKDVNNVQAVATNGLKSHQKWAGEYRIINKNGAELYWYGTGIGIYDQEGNPIKVVGAVTDITERKRAELLERALYEIARVPETAKSLNDLYHVVHLIIKGLMPTENFYVALYDEKENLLRYPYFVDEIDAWPLPEKPGKGLTAYVLRTGRTLLCDAALDEELIRRGEVEMVGSPSACWLGAPLKVGEKIIGIIALQHYSDSKAYGEREKQVLDFVSGQIANTIERKRTEEALKKSEEKFVKAFKSSPVAICITRISDGKFIEVNESVEKLSGYSRTELLTGSTIGLNLWADSEDRKQVVEQLAKTSSIHDHEYRFRIKSGNEIVVRYSAEVIGFNDERCCLSVLVDITEQKKMEESLRESEEKYRSIVENTQDIIMLTGPDGRVSYLSPACVRVLGYNPDELVGKIPEIVYPDDVEKVHNALSGTLQGGNGSNLEYRILTKNGKTRWVSHSWSPILTENHELKCIVNVVRDITESKIAEQTLKEKIEELEKYKNVTVNREVKMVDLKNEINELCKQLNQKPKYSNV